MQIGVETSRAVENKRIFVVDADDITRAVLQFMLQDENETHDLIGLEEAYAKGREWPPDLLLLGLTIVQERGAGILADIARELPGARIVLVADAGDGATARRHLNHGAHAVLTKPLTVEGVRRAVDLQLGRTKPSLVQLQLAPVRPQ